MIKSSMWKNELLYNEVKSGEEGEKLKCAYLMQDPDFRIPWDIHNSLVYRLKNMIPVNVKHAEERWLVHFRSYIPQIDYYGTNGQDMIPVVEHIYKWTKKFPKT